MERSPGVSKIKDWLSKINPLGLFKGKRFSVQDIDRKPWSGHFNYLVVSGEKRLVLRFKGPEWGEQTTGILDEYRTLLGVEKYGVGPKVYFLHHDFFGEPAILEEYLDGKTVGSFPINTLEKMLPAIAGFIARINRIPADRRIFTFREPLTSYAIHKKTWKSRLKVILQNSRTRPLGIKLEKLLPQAERMLDYFEPQLRKALRSEGSSFIFTSAHPGHCLKMRHGFRFLNWEKISFGDPAFTLSVFLAPFIEMKHFKRLKELMVKAYLDVNGIARFAELVDHRLKEREVSNALWVLWAYAVRGATGSVAANTGIGRRLERVRAILDVY